MQHLDNTKETIQRALANLRIKGVKVYEVFVDVKAFRELEEDPSIDKVYSPDRDTYLRLMTCNGPVRVKKD